MSETNTKRIVVDGVLPSLPSPVEYTTQMLGCKPLKGTGRGVVISLIDSGVPDHEALLTLGGDVNFTKSPDSRDMTGHATSLAGIMVANKPDQIIGIAPDAVLLCAKAVDDNCMVRFDALIASVLWSIVRDVDIIVIPVVTEINSPPFEAAIQKAISHGIYVVAATGNNNKVEYPASYEGVISVGARAASGQIASYSGIGKINLLGENLETTYIDHSYCVVCGTSVATAVVGGLLARAIETDKKNGFERVKLICKE
jgi:hypothetical protein